MENMKVLAYRFLLDTGINTLPITQEALEEISEKESFSLLPYSMADVLLSHLKPEAKEQITDRMNKNNSIAIVNKSNTVILYRSTLCYSERIAAILHEIGHIRAKHRSCDGCCADGENSRQEEEAWAFARYVLAPPCILSELGDLSVQRLQQITGLDYADAKRAMLDIPKDGFPALTWQEKELQRQFRHYINDNPIGTLPKKRISVKWLLAAILIFAAAFLVSALLLSAPETSTVPHQPAASETAAPKTAEDTRYVCITSAGTKYHKPDCPHLLNHEYIEITLAEAVRVNKTPCKTCKP